MCLFMPCLLFALILMVYFICHSTHCHPTRRPSLPTTLSCAHASICTATTVGIKLFIVPQIGSFCALTNLFMDVITCCINFSFLFVPPFFFLLYSSPILVFPWFFLAIPFGFRVRSDLFVLDMSTTEAVKQSIIDARMKNEICLVNSQLPNRRR
jgi:hypothetical protein